MPECLNCMSSNQAKSYTQVTCGQMALSLTSLEKGDLQSRKRETKHKQTEQKKDFKE